MVSDEKSDVILTDLPHQPCIITLWPFSVLVFACSFQKFNYEVSWTLTSFFFKFYFIQHVLISDPFYSCWCIYVNPNPNVSSSLFISILSVFLQPYTSVCFCPLQPQAPPFTPLTANSPVNFTEASLALRHLH